MVNIVGISGSLRKDSSNTAVLKAISKVAGKGVEMNIYEDLGTIPHFDPTIAVEDSPDAVKNLRTLLKEANAVIICTPEYAFGVPGVLKNALDWLVSSGEMNEKPVGIISASPLHRGGNHAHASLVLTLTALGTKMSEHAKLMIGNVYNKMNDKKEVVDEETVKELRSLVHSLTDGLV
ncbi:MAG: NAD(P)H-dependent oxidoreductase [Flavipsychrobacter sp.]